MQKYYYSKHKIKEIFPEPGIYRLFTKDLIEVYIGQSVNLRKRLMEHIRTTYMEFDYFDYDFFPKSKLSEVERREIAAFKQNHGCRPKYNNLL